MKIRVWIIDCMGEKARLCLSEDDNTPEILVGPKVFENKKMLVEAIIYSKKEARKYLSRNKLMDQ
ncbi:hypothetical protein [Dehalobacter restrictus]|uniref:Uncharacterized protein n=1 Tax=Dehalobacter restrictus (strain DSM 9455 / PER-K23) TaxID=871738 RepID=A0ABN4BPI3_DEHRP|nr:hypothetical protein [Dehalobacter restrictus]AHF09411.1 hypothetical protein DEHRE_04385 [Dehalobacter restrictus DSM 9455]